MTPPRPTFRRSPLRRADRGRDRRPARRSLAGRARHGRAYERKQQDRATVLAKVESLRGDEPWPGYDELTVDEIRDALRRCRRGAHEAVRGYERAHKNRAGVIDATERELANA